MKRLEFHISYKCNHNCIFCSEEERMIKFKDNPISNKEIKVILLDRKKKWFNHINFTGWEPTIIPNFLEVVEFTKKIWYKIYIGTNWIMLYSEDFASELLWNIDELSLSIHWFDKDSCKKQIWSSKHFENIGKIIENINKYKKSDTELFLNIVLNRYNYKDVIKIIEFVDNSGYNFWQVLVSYIAPEWAGLRNYSELSIDLNEFQKLIPSIVNLCEKKGKVLRFFWLPYCILWEKYWEYSNDLHWEPRNTIERIVDKSWKVSLIDINSVDNTRERSFVAKCDNCKWKLNPCGWVFAKYLEYYNF